MLFGLLSSISYAQDRSFKVTGRVREPSAYYLEGDFPLFSEAEQNADERATASCNGPAKRVSEFEHAKKCNEPPHPYLKATTLATAEYECE